MLTLSVIPKIVHYCWFGYNEKTDLILKCIASWKKYLHDFEIVEWNEKNFDVYSTSFTSTAYDRKKYAFVSDYVRAFALHQFGGVYLDTDVEVTQDLSPFLEHSAFSGFEGENYPFTAVWGSEKGHPWPGKVLNSYQNIEFIDESTPSNTKSISDLLVSDFGIDRSRNEIQLGLSGIAIYPSSTFCIDLPPNFARHHFAGSWVDNGVGSFKYASGQFWREKNFATEVEDGDIGHALIRLVKLIGVKKCLFSVLKLWPRIFSKAYHLIIKKHILRDTR